MNVIPLSFDVQPFNHQCFPARLAPYGNLIFQGISEKVAIGMSSLRAAKLVKPSTFYKIILKPARFSPTFKGSGQGGPDKGSR
ncbi:MAG: hypothetical protein VB980_01325, partial [Opitutales bacterium]